MANRLNTLKTIVKEIIELSKKSDILADHKSKQFCKYYLNSNDLNANLTLKYDIVSTICNENGLKLDKIYDKFQNLTLKQSKVEFSEQFSQHYYERLSNQLQPEYYKLFKSLSRVQDGVKTLVTLRQDLLEIIEKNEDLKLTEHLKIMNSNLKELLTLLFSTGLLQVQRITWNSPASLVEKIAHFESVHPIRSLNELKIRLSNSRRCFIFTHSSMPYEPLVILHIALTKSISSNIVTLIRHLDNDVIENDDDSNSSQATHAIFYSISSCQKGLKNVDLGNSLIKNCVQLLKNEFTNLKNFHTLSPIPGFAAWLNLKLVNNFDENLMKFLQSEKFIDILQAFEIKLDNKDTFSVLKSYLNSNAFRNEVFNAYCNTTTSNENVKLTEKAMLCVDFLHRICAYYLINEKQRGYALNSVCNFHIKNGAYLDRLNFAADLTNKGWKQSFSFMCNYTYSDLDRLDLNCINYLNTKIVPHSDSIKKLF